MPYARVLSPSVLRTMLATALVSGAVAAFVCPALATPPACGIDGRPVPDCGHDPRPKCPCPPSGPPAVPTSGGEPEDEAVPQFAPGMFAAPPRSGATMAASRTLGIRGMAITFPELTLRLPSIEFPSCQTSTRATEMVLDSARAPYVANPYYAQQVMAWRAQQLALRNGAPQDPSASPQAAPGADCSNGQPSSAAAMNETQRQLDDCQRQLKDLQNCVRLQMEQMERCLQKLEAAERGGAHYAPPAHVPPRAPVGAPPYPAPTSDVRFVPHQSPSPSTLPSYPVHPSVYHQPAASFAPQGPVRPVAPRLTLERLPPVD